MMKYFILTILCCLLFSSYAQKEFVSGYIVTAKGDTLRGEIDNRKWVKNPTSVIFREIGKSYEKYDADNLNGFGVTNENVYVKKRVSVDVTPYLEGRLLNTRERKIVKDSVLLLKQFIKGRISLYYFKDETSKPHFYIQKMDGPLEELINHKYLLTIGDKTFERNVELYNAQLFDLCQDCSLYTGKALTYSFTEGDIAPAILKYNAFFGDNTAKVTSAKEKLSVDFYIKAIGGGFSYEIMDRYERFFKSGLLTTAFGGGVLIELPSERKKVGVKIDLLYQVYSEGVRSMFPSYYVVPKNKAYLTLRLTPQYSFYKKPSKKLELFVNGGLDYQRKLGNQGNFDYDKTEKYILGYKLGLGVRKKSFELELSSLNSDGGINVYTDYLGSLHQTCLSLAYYFR